MAIFQVFVGYSQLSVFDPSLSEPFNNWTPGHVAQGFAWRPGSASFAIRGLTATRLITRTSRN
jgi:Competence protein J (ComJ)